MKSHLYPIFEHESIDSVTFRTINKLAHYLKMFQLKFAAATTIIVEVSKLQCQMPPGVYTVSYTPSILYCVVLH